jgi:hypothetical protein
MSKLVLGTSLINISTLDCVRHSICIIRLTLACHLFVIMFISRYPFTKYCQSKRKNMVVMDIPEWLKNTEAYWYRDCWGGLFSLTSIPSGAWQASFLLFFTGAFSFGVTVILGILIHCVRQKYVYNVNSLVVSRRVNLVTNPVINHEWGKNREVFTTSGTYPWSFVRQIFHNGQPSRVFTDVCW